MSRGAAQQIHPSPKQSQLSEHCFNNIIDNPRTEDEGTIFPRAFSILGIWIPTNYSLLLDNISQILQGATSTGRSSQASPTHPLLCLLGKHCLLRPFPFLPFQTGSAQRAGAGRHLEVLAKERQVESGWWLTGSSVGLWKHSSTPVPATPWLGTWADRSKRNSWCLNPQFSLHLMVQSWATLSLWASSFPIVNMDLGCFSCFVLLPLTS